MDVPSEAPASAPSLWEMMLEADPIVQLDLAILVGMSVACWAIVVMKWTRLAAAQRSSVAFVDAFWKAKRLDQIFDSLPTWSASPVAAVFSAGYRELVKVHGQAGDPSDNVERALRRAIQVESHELRRFIVFLATTGSTAPFIGLFGTVWGILRAFLALGKPGVTATMQAVGPEIAHALVATAVGLVAAIPAVMAYNGYNRWISTLDAEMENFASDFLNLVRRKATSP